MGTTESPASRKLSCSTLSAPTASPPAPEQLFRGSSRLCPSLHDVLFAQDALPHLIDFMEDRSILHFLRFWLDCEQFYGVCKAQELPIHAKDDEDGAGDALFSDCWSADNEGDNVPSGLLSSGSLPATAAPPVSLLAAPPVLLLAAPPVSLSVEDSSDSFNVSGKDSGRPSGFTGLGMKPSPSMRRFSKDIQDNAVRIYSQYISLEAPDSVGIDQAMRTQILDNMCQESGQVNNDSFRAAQDKIFEILKDKVFVDFLPSFHFLRYKSSLILSDRVTLTDILNYHQTLERFVEFVEEVGGINFVRFILSAVQFEAQWKSASRLEQYNAEWAQNDAMIIYDRYISMQAAHPIDLSDSLRVQVEESICCEGGVSADCFRQAVNAVYSHLSAVYLPAFFKSQPFMSYLLELDTELKKAMVVAGIMSTPLSTKRKTSRIWQKPQRSKSEIATRREEQDTSSMISSVSVPSSENGRNRTESECDSRSSHSLDFSGTTSRLRKMAMGEVDALGRFVSYGEAEPVEKTTSFFSRTVRKIKRSDENERKKEQASLDAQRIIEDTLSQAMSAIPSFSADC